MRVVELECSKLLCKVQAIGMSGIKVCGKTGILWFTGASECVLVHRNSGMGCCRCGIVRNETEYTQHTPAIKRRHWLERSEPCPWELAVSG